MTKKCLKCQETLSIESFYLVTKPSGKRYRVSPCKTCRKKAWRKRYYTDPKKHVDRATAWRKQNPEKQRSTYLARYHRLKKEVFEHYGGCCACCGEKHLVFLAIDHINGGGTRHMKEVGVGESFWRWLQKNSFPKGFRVLCHNCNWAVAFGRVCPHTLSTN